VLVSSLLDEDFIA